MTNSKILFRENLHIDTINTYDAKIYIVDEVFDLLQKAYANVKGGLHFISHDDLLINTAMWKIIYDDINIIGVVIYKAKQGLKMVAMGLSHKLHHSYKRVTKHMLVYIFKTTFTKTWMELSEGAEQFILKNGGENFILSNHLAAKLTGKEILELCEDGIHYKRMINGIVKTKILLGNPKMVLNSHNMSNKNNTITITTTKEAQHG
jgi:hypothetical protein